MFSSRTGWDLTPNPLARRLEARRRSGLDVIDLTLSNPTRCGFAYPGAAILGALSRPEGLPYAPHPRGLREAREAVSAHLAAAGCGVDPDRIVLAASTSEAYSFLFRLLCDPGDEVLVPRPGYPLFGYLAGLDDVCVATYPLRYAGRETGWTADGKSLATRAGARARAVVAVNPNNPTGSCFRAEDRAALLRLCRERDLALIADEVFADYPFDPAVALPRMAGTREALTFALGGLSKTCGLPQLKLAWIAASGPDDRVDAALARLEVIADTYLSVATPVQRALGDLLRAAAPVGDAIRARVRGNRNALLDAAGEGGPVSCLAADGGWYAVLALPGTRTDEEWALDLLDRDGVLVHPGHFYDFEEEGRVVVSLLPTPEAFQEGIRRLLLRAGTWMTSL